MSCAAEKAAFMRALMYRQRPTPYSSIGGSHYGAPTALVRAYQESERNLRPKSFGGGRSDFQIKLAYTPQSGARVQRSHKQDGYSGWTIVTEPNHERTIPLIDMGSKKEEIVRVDYAPMTYDASVHRQQQDLEQMIQQEKHNGTTAHKYGASLY